MRTRRCLSQVYAADATSRVIATQYNCGQEGHISAECPNPKVEGGVKAEGGVLASGVPGVGCMTLCV